MAWSSTAISTCLGLIETTRTCATETDLRRLFDAFKGIISADHCILGITDGRTTDFVWTDFPHKWVDTHVTEGFTRIDPVVRYQIDTNGAARDWSHALMAGPRASWLPLQELSLDHGLRNGLAAGMRDPLSGRMAILSVSALQRPFRPRDGAIMDILLPHIFLAVLRVRRNVDITAVIGPSDLTAREREVLRLIAGGYRTAEAASALGLSPHTVHDHVKAIYRKLGVSTRAEVALEAARRGIVDPVSPPEQGIPRHPPRSYLPI